MPQGDRTGPEGLGSKTGRQLGDCEGAKPNNACFGRGVSRGRAGFGRGFRQGFRFRQPIAQPQVITKPEEKKILEEDLKNLKLEMQEIEKRLKELKN